MNLLTIETNSLLFNQINRRIISLCYRLYEWLLYFRFDLKTRWKLRSSSSRFGLTKSSSLPPTAKSNRNVIALEIGLSHKLTTKLKETFSFFFLFYRSTGSTGLYSSLDKATSPCQMDASPAVQFSSSCCCCCRWKSKEKCS
jgi:hypothetical protein